MFKTSIKTVLPFLIFALSFPLKAAETPAAPTILTLKRIFNTDEFDAQEFGPARWLQHRQGYTTLEPSETQTGGKDIVRYDPQTGKREMLMSVKTTSLSRTWKPGKSPN